MEMGFNPSTSTVNGRTSLLEVLKKGNKETAKLLIEYPGTFLGAMHRGDKPEDFVSDKDVANKIKSLRSQQEADLKYFQKEFRVKDKYQYIEKGESFLICAIQAKDMRALRGCIFAFPVLKVTGYNEELSASTALHEVVLTDNTEIVCYLLSMLCLDVNATNSLEERPIHMATSINSVKMLEVLFEKGCDVNAKDDIGYTALHDAAERGNLNAVKCL